MYTCASAIHRKLAITNAVGYLKGKSAIAIVCQFGKKIKELQRGKLLVQRIFRIHCGFDEAVIQEDIRIQGERDRYFEQMSLLDR